MPELKNAFVKFHRRVAELDALLGKEQNAATSNNGGSDRRIKSQDEMIYWANRRQERNTLLAESYRLVNKSA